jgi:alpha-L-fucosidase
MNFNKLILACLSLTAFAACNGVKAPQPFGALPSDAQVEWQKMEYNMFVHFGPNTFTSAEWGDGKESADVFNPTDLDCRQWAATAKAAGMKGIIITAKHHDGFCLWPNPVCQHTVAQSSWRDGKGDVLKELSEACKEYGLKFGIYISPWDQNDPHYGTDGYNDVFVKTLEHALGSYGHVFEQWFDGACGEGPNGKKQVYDWPLFYSTVYKQQPEAIIFSNVGPGCRWVGNEYGSAGRTCWGTMNVGEHTPSTPISTDLLNVGNPDGETWVAAETDVSIRPGWFWRESENDKVKSIQQLLKIYYESVGRNSLLLLNVPADKRGHLHEIDSVRLMELRVAIDEIFATDLAAGASAEASAVRGGSRKYAAANVLDADYDTYWATDDEVTAASFTVTLPEARTFNRVQIQEYIPLGQRVSAFSIEALGEDGQWKVIANETTIGYKRIVHTPVTTATAVRVNIEESLACPLINGFALFMDNIYVSDEKANIPVGEVKPATEALTVDLGEVRTIKGFVYSPMYKGEGGCIVAYDLEVSKDGSAWTKVFEGKRFENIINNPTAREVSFDAPLQAKAVRLVPVRVEISAGAAGQEHDTYGVAEFHVTE